MVPTGTGKPEKPVKMGEHFRVTEKSGNFTRNTGKLGNFETGKLAKYWKSQGNLSARKSKNHGNMVASFK